MCPICWLDTAWILLSGLVAGAAWLWRAGLTRLLL